MAVIIESEKNDQLRETFFRTALGKAEGILAVAYKSRTGDFRNAYFQYPDELPNLLVWINTHVENRDLYFCPQLLNEKHRIKTAVSTCPNLWADLDEVVPEKVKPEPSIVIQSSSDRYQALWVLKSPIDPHTAEDLSRRLTYSNGADTSGWDLTQLLRIPLTYNLKYGQPEIVKASSTGKLYEPADFDAVEEVPAFKVVGQPMPEVTLDPDEVLAKYRRKLLPHVHTLFVTPPNKDWSTALWSMETAMIEAGMSAEEAFAVARAAATNKYARDGRGDEELWREVLKAKASVEVRISEDIPPIKTQPLMTDAERAHVNQLDESFIDRYAAWGRARSDAAYSYHQAGALTILSTLLSDKLKLETSFGSIIPNLWMMLLGDSTLSRKTTSMEMAVEVLNTVAEDAILATDGSMEGILSAMGLREGRTSLFWRDEFAGMLDSMQKRDYHTGMIEALTKLYDGKYLKRVLRREIVEVRNPILVMYAGGIRSRILELLGPHYVLSGFIPRFVFFIGESDATAFRPIGPPTKITASDGILDEVGKIHHHYSSLQTTKVGDQVFQTRKVWDVTLTPQAWDRYNQLEQTLVLAGSESESPDLYTPTMDRLAKSALKTAVLIAASRQIPPVVVEADDILRSITLAETWVRNAVTVVTHAGKSASERTVERAMTLIQNGKDTRSGVMKSMHLNSRETDLILDTLEQRGLIIRTKYGKLEKLFPTAGARP